MDVNLGLGTYLCVLFAYTTMVVPFTIIDYFDLLPQYRIERRRGRKEKENHLFQLALQMVLINFIWLLPATYLATPILNELLLTQDAPSPFENFYILFQLICFFVIDDICFYIYHRILHEVPWLYKQVHKPHHVFTEVFAAVSHAVHPVEMMLQGIGTCVGPLLVFYKQVHPHTWYIWLIIRQWQGIEDHIGYEFWWSPTFLIPGIGGSRHHDYHHQYFECNYASVFSLFDHLFGTSYEQWRKRSIKKPS
jgi:sterol desaturase/sphingolipid hydroxylase (fatty acid hydroxylase superfamily)